MMARASTCANVFLRKGGGSVAELVITTKRTNQTRGVAARMN